MNTEEYMKKVRQLLNDSVPEEACEELRLAFEERVLEAGEDTACVEFGSPSELALLLNEEYKSEERDEFDPPEAGEFLRVPFNFSLDSQWWKRVFNPADPRFIVPHAYGWGWSINLGAVAVALGGIRPDDVDEDTISHLHTRDAAIPLAAACGALGLSAVLIYVSGARRRENTAEAGKENCEAFRLGALALGASSLPTLLKRPVIERLAAQSVAYVVLGGALGEACGARLKPAAKAKDSACVKRKSHPVFGAVGALIGAGGAVAGLSQAIRKAVVRTAREERQGEKDE